MKPFLAALASDPAANDPLSGLQENAPPVKVPWPEWIWWVIGIAALLALLFFVWIGVRIGRRKMKEMPPSPRSIAQRELEHLRQSGADLDAYDFGVAVSDILRTYIAKQYGLQTTQQTSVEFLTSIHSSPRFSDSERRLLSAFLEQTDLRKFARVPAGESEALLSAAFAFVEGAAA